MARAKKEPKPRLHQSAIPGAIETIPELDDLIHAQHNREQDVTEARGALKSAHLAVMALMRKLSKTLYRTASGYTARLKPGQDKVIVKKASESKPRRKSK